MDSYLVGPSSNSRPAKLKPKLVRAEKFIIDIFESIEHIL